MVCQYCSLLKDILTDSGEICGLELRRDKCDVWSKGALNTIDSRIKRNSREGIEILGAVGSPIFVAPSTQTCSKDRKTTGETTVHKRPTVCSRHST